MSIKQRITLEQWDELSKDERLNFMNRVGDYRKNLGGIPSSFEVLELYALRKVGLPTIGQMIEYIGENWYKELFSAECDKEYDCIVGEVVKEYKDEVCDVLWGLCKIKTKVCQKKQTNTHT